MSSYFGAAPGTVALLMAGAVGVVLLILGALALKNPVLLRMSVRNIPRRRAQTTLIVFGLMLASLIIMASFGVGDTLGYSLKAIQLKQMGGIDEAVIRTSTHGVQGAGFTDADYLTDAQAADVVTKVKADPNVQEAAGVIVSDGSVNDPGTRQSSAENVLLMGAPPAFDRLWGRLVSRSGATLSVADLAPDEVYLGNTMADKLNAGPRDNVKLIVSGRVKTMRVRDVLNTEVDPNIAAQGPVVTSVLAPIAAMRDLLQRPTGFNVVYIHNHGSGGLDDLGPSGAIGQEISRRLRGVFTDPVAAAQLKDYLNQPSIHSQVVLARQNASFLDPTQAALATLLAELDKAGVTDQFKATVQDDNVAQALHFAVLKSLPSGASQQAIADAERNFGEHFAALNVDTASATMLKTVLAQPAESAALAQAAARTGDGDPTKALLVDLMAEVAKPETTPHFKALVAAGPGPRLLTQLVGQVAPSRSVDVTSALAGLRLYQLSPYKQAAVDFAQQVGLVSLALLLGVSAFSITVGILLIFLIFVMLAAERRAEMGMSRAVGLKRRHLTQMFLFEGFAYTLGAATVGVALGIGVGALMINVISSFFTSFSSGLTLTYHVEPANVVVALCLGILLTFVVVGASAYRVSRLNIVAAIRDIDETGKRDEGLASYVLGIFRTVASGTRMLLRGHPITFLRRSTLGVLGAIRALIWALFRRGPFTLAVGVLLVATGLGQHGLLLYDAGVGIMCIGIGLTVRWLLATFGSRPSIAGRIGFTLAALGLVLFFGQPFGKVEKLLHVDKSAGVDKLSGGPEIFIFASLLLILGAIWLVMYNSDILVRGVMLFGRGLGSTGAAVRTSMSYPMATKFRTGMTVAMFATVTFIIAYMAVFQDVLSQSLGRATQRAGGWQLVAGTPDNNFSGSGPTTVVPPDLAQRVAADPRLATEVRATGWENAGRGVQFAQVVDGRPVRPQGRQGDNFQVGLHVVDDGYLKATTYALQPRAEGFSSDRAVWDAVRTHEGYAVIDASVLSAGRTAVAPVSGVNPTDTTFKPFEVELSTSGAGRGSAAKPWRVTVIGFTQQPLWEGLYISTNTALHRSTLFVPPPADNLSIQEALAAAGDQQPLVPTGYYFELKPGVDVKTARLDLGRLLVDLQLEPVSVADQLAAQTSGNVTLFNLLTGFLALGLIVGIAGLGVISTRAVVERRQQIGMLRALGFRRSLVQFSFLLESSFIAILGLLIGAGLGVWQSYRFIAVDKAFGAVAFHLPLVQLILILGGAYLATILTTYLPARAASRVAPAEALRYE